MAPVVNLKIDYKRQLAYGDTVIVETEYVDQEVAKVLFRFSLFRKSDKELVATAESTQVFVNMEREMIFYAPPFVVEWKRKVGLIE